MNHTYEPGERLIYETRREILSRPRFFHLENLYGCFSCGSSTPTVRCLCQFNVQDTMNTVFIKCIVGSIDNDNIREILTQFGGERRKKIARGFGYSSNINSQASTEIIAIIFGILCGWFNDRGDDVYVRAASNAWCKRDHRVNHQQLIRQQKWDADVTNRRIIPPPLMGQLKISDFNNYKMFAIRGQLKECIKTQYFGLVLYNELNNELRLEQRRNQTYPDINIPIPPQRRIQQNNQYHVIPPNQPILNNQLYNTVLQQQQQPINNQHINLHRPVLQIQPSRELLEITYKRRLWRVIQIHNQTIPENELLKEPEPCPICFENIELNKCVLTNCRHKMCCDCVEYVMVKCGNKCVICRAKVNNLQFESMEQIIRYQEIKIKALVAA